MMGSRKNIVIVAFCAISSGLFPRAGDCKSTEGQRLYLAYCAACHGRDGRGNGRVASRIKGKPCDLTKEGFLVKKTDRELKDAIMRVDGSFHGTRYLPSMQVNFTQEEVFELINYIRHFQTVPHGDPIEGRKLYVAYCAACHGRNGRGNGEKVVYLDVKPKDQSDDAYMSQKTDQELFSAIQSGGGAIHGARFMPKWRKTLRPKEIWDIVSYIRLLHRGRTRDGNSDKGKRFFLKYCSPCHGEGGGGRGAMADILTPKPRDLRRGPIEDRVTDQDLFFTVLGGGKAMGLSDQMPAWGYVLSEGDVWDIVKYIRSLR